jgi:hypothetical protein
MKVSRAITGAEIIIIYSLSELITVPAFFTPFQLQIISFGYNNTVTPISCMFQVLLTLRWFLEYTRTSEICLKVFTFCLLKSATPAKLLCSDWLAEKHLCLLSKF